MSKFTVSVVVPEGLSAGDVFEVEVEAPAKVRKPRGQLAGVSLEEMTDEQLKREIVNAGSVLYKAKQRNAPEATIAADEARLAAAKAEKAKRAPAKAEEPATEGDEVYDEQTAAEV